MRTRTCWSSSKCGMPGRRYARATLGRIQNCILPTLSPRISFKMAATHHRVSRDQEWDSPAVGMWVAHHGAELNESVHPHPQLFFEEVATHPPTTISWEWRADHTHHMSLHDIVTCTSLAREEETLQLQTRIGHTDTNCLDVSPTQYRSRHVCGSLRI